jgi:hypothetical protein
LLKNFLAYFREQQKNEINLEDVITKDQTQRSKQGRGQGRAGSARRKSSFDYFNAVQMLG